MKPLVSVILPTYNRARLLPRAIASVLNQSFDDLELIVVDDCSTDDTEQVVRSFNDYRVVFVAGQRNRGDAGARNYGAQRARGKYLAFQDSDDEWLPHKLEVQVAYIQTLPEDCAMVGSTLLRVAGSSVEKLRWPIIDGSGKRGWVDTDRFIAGSSAYLQSIIVRKSAFDELGGFDTGLRARSDFEFCLRLTRKWRLAGLDEALALSYETPDGISGRGDYRIADARHILAKHSDLIGKNAAVLGRYYYDLAKAEFSMGDSDAGRRSAWKALTLNPGALRTWALVLAGAFGAGAVTGLTHLSQRASKMRTQRSMSGG
jgi:glycosyltransferase involved in cell wall biosynthesis